MDTKLIKDVMVPLSEYATVSEDATLQEAVLALDKAQKAFDQSRYQHRAVLVFDQRKKIVGKLSQLDIIRALEPKYEQMGKSNPLSQVGLSRFGFSPRFMKELVKEFKLWEKPLSVSCREAAKMKVKEAMYTPTEGEFVEDTASLAVGIHQLIMGHHQSLLVTHEKEIVGILRLTDVFQEVKNMFDQLKPA